MAHTHLVGLVDVVAVEGAEQVRQAGHVVIVDGVDDGLHHKGVFLILRQKGTASPGGGDSWASSSSQDDLILCPPRSPLYQHRTPLSLSFISPHALTGREAAVDQNTSSYFLLGQRPADLHLDGKGTPTKPGKCQGGGCGEVRGVGGRRE